MYEYGIDLHMHSNYSDGELSPNALIKKSYKKNINVISITDHDTILGLKNINKDYDNLVRVITGIELTAKYNNGNMHILGYGINIRNSELNMKLKEIRDININYIINILAVLKKDYDIAFSYEEIKNLVNVNHNLNRVDIARLCVENGYVDNVQEAFNKYLKEAYNKIGGNSKGLEYTECINLIKNSGGIPVLAHPKTLKLSEDELYKLVNEMKYNGLMGIECFHSSHSKEQTKLYLDIAKRLDLLISGGSDFHGKFTKPNVHLGIINNNERIIKKELTIMSRL